MENRNNVRFIPTIETPSFPRSLEEPALSVRGSLRKIVREMRVLESSYQDAIREFQQRYIVVVLIKHACHLGNAAADLGMHRNTLTRIIQKLDIDPKLIRRGCVEDRIAAGREPTHNHFGDTSLIA